MHVISGIVLSLLLKNRIDKRAAGPQGFRGIIEAEHVLPGRVRYRIPCLREPGKARLLEASLAKLRGVESCQINPVSAGALIRFDPGELPAEMLTPVILQILELDRELERDPSPLVRREVTTLVKSLNRGVYEASRGVLDLYTLVPFSLIAVGLVKTVRERRFSTPASLTLLWWGYQTFFVNGRRHD